jgi:hypothetical protein
MPLIKAAAILAGVFVAVSAYADGKCETKAKTRDDFLACTRADTKKSLSDAEKLYRNIRRGISGEKLVELDNNYRLWGDRFKSECKVIGYAFNDWSSEYAPDTDFQVSACESDIAKQELEFYKYLSCPEDMETSTVPKCATIGKVLGRLDPQAH